MGIGHILSTEGDDKFVGIDCYMDVVRVMHIVGAKGDGQFVGVDYYIG